MHVILVILECLLLDYILLCGILYNPQWSFGWPPAYLYEWVDSVQDLFLLIVSCSRTSFGATSFSYLKS